jgi:uncharacterized membrane protein HdeD (DUF308 family)
MLAGVICLVIGVVILGLYRGGRISSTNYTMRNLGIILLVGGALYAALAALNRESSS